MKSVQQLLMGLIAAVGTSLLVLGAFSLALVENGTQIAAVQNTLPVLPSPTATTAIGSTPVNTETASPTLPPVQPTSCPIPAGWQPYIIQTGDTLEALAEQVGLSAAELRSSNCLSGVTLIPNAILHLPTAAGPTHTATVMLPTPLPTLPPTLTPIPCGPPPGWVPYVVQRGDTLFRLSIAFGITQDTLRIGNCMTGTNLIAGQILYVPYVITRTPAVTRTSTSTNVPPTATQMVPTAVSPSPTGTFTPTATILSTATLTSTPEPNGTATQAAEPTALTETLDPLPIEPDP